MLPEKQPDEDPRRTDGPDTYSRPHSSEALKGDPGPTAHQYTTKSAGAKDEGGCLALAVMLAPALAAGKVVAIDHGPVLGTVAAAVVGSATVLIVHAVKWVWQRARNG